MTQTARSQGLVFLSAGGIVYRYEAESDGGAQHGIDHDCIAADMETLHGTSQLPTWIWVDMPPRSK